MGTRQRIAFSTRMRVGVVAPEFPPEIGGIQTYAYEFVRELARRGFRVTVYTLRQPDGQATVPGVTVLPVLRRRRTLDRRILAYDSADVWHVMNAAYSWLALETAPVLASVHGNDFLKPYILVARPSIFGLSGQSGSSSWQARLGQTIGRRLTQRLVGRALPRVGHIFANSRYTEQALLAQYPSCRGRTSVALVGVSAEFLQAEPARGAIGHSRLITVCRLADPRKNVDLVLRALAHLRGRHDFSYTVAGDGPLRPGLERLAAELGLEDRVRFTGVVGGAELRRLLAESDLFVLTSSVGTASHEGFGIAYLEANACGTPVLAARLAGAVEAVDEGISGYFVDQPTPESIAEALARFFREDLRFDPAACRSFAGRFTWKRVVDHVVRHYPGAGIIGPQGIHP